ncbi:Protein ltv1 [Coemansia sp. RSA 1085]|nr:Protein ltv1 [Coemansia sp. RSA 1085]
MSKQFVDKKKAKTYSLVYRSQEDPLAFEEGSTDRVLVERGRRKVQSKGKAAEQLAADLGDLQLEDKVGKAALYGVFLDDSKYDYTQHLREVGTGGGILLNASSKHNSDLPAEVLPSQHRMDIKSAAYPVGPQPFMDANVRDVLEALSDEDLDEIDDDFMAKLNADELSSYEEEEEEEEDFDHDDVFAQIERMKRQQQQQRQRQRQQDTDNESDQWSEDYEDEAKSNFSMSSSAMFRNAKLTLLDEQFDKLEAIYEHDDTDSEAERYDSDGHYIAEYDSDGNVKPISSRADFESVLNEFLNDYELTGKKMQAVVEGGSGAGKLDTYRDGLVEGSEASKRAVVQAAQRILEESATKSDKQDADELDEIFKEKERTPWDCQSILSTYSTLDNHPATIHEKRTPRIRVSSKSGFPVVVEDQPRPEAEPRPNRGAPRPKNETAEEKRLRKKQLQEERRKRREQKRETQSSFAEKKKRSMQSKKDRRQHVVQL